MTISKSQAAALEILNACSGPIYIRDFVTRRFPVTRSQACGVARQHAYRRTSGVILKRLVRAGLVLESHADRFDPRDLAQYAISHAGRVALYAHRASQARRS